MTLIDFFRLIGRHYKLILAIGLFAGLAVFFATKDTKKQYTSHTLINTGLVSGYSIESSGGGRVDYAYTNNELANLVSLASSYETTEELATTLFAQYLMLKKPDSLLISAENYQLLKEEVGHSFWQKVTDFNSSENTLANVIKYRDMKSENPINKIIYSKHEYFGIEQLENLQITRVQNSDMLRFKYSTTDPGICRQTLIALTDIFIQKQTNIKRGQSTDVLAFFDKATKESSAVLKGKEDELLQFMVRNKIINYYEQTRFIASKKEELDEMFFKEQMKLAAADSALHRVKAELSQRYQMPELNQNLLSKKAELTNLSVKVARFESMTADNPTSTVSQIEFLKDKVAAIKEEMKTTATATFALQRTPEGAEMKNLLTQWLNQLLESEQSSARLKVFRQRKKEFDATYQKFAPWGSKLKRIEREIDVAERAYLENLHSYNQARLHQHSMLMSTNLKVTDAPFLPAKPASSKRGILIIAAFLGGLVLSTGSLTALEIMDGTLKTPLHAKEVIGMNLLGAFPFFPNDWKTHKTINFQSIHSKSFGQLYQNIKLTIHNLPNDNIPRRLTFFSTRQGEGKSFVSYEMVKLLRAAGEKVLYLCPESPQTNKETEPDDHFYKVDHTFFEKQSEQELLPDLSLDIKSYDFVVFEIPGLLSGSYPVDLVAKSDLALMVTRANRTWNSADSTALKRFAEGVENAPFLVLNATRLESLEETLGELPKKRSYLRKVVKNLTNKEFVKGA